MNRVVTLVFFVGCAQSNPPPQYAQPSQPPEAQPAVAAEPPAPEEPAPPPAPPEEPLPIDPEQDMPAQSLTTDAKLALGEEATVMIDARSDIFSASAKKADPGRGGVLPSMITLAPGGGIISVPKVIGKAGCMGDAAYAADGGDCAGGNTDLRSAGGISGIVAHDRTLFLVGVFLADKAPKKAPARLDFGPEGKGTTFTKLEPELGQVFFIGDGSPGNPPGGTHDFVIPKGATKLYLGYADGFSFQGPPGAYGDNKGGLKVTVLQRK